MCLLNVMQNSLSRQLSLPGREQHIGLLPVMFQCATASSDASHLTLLLAVRYSSGCQAHLDAQRRLHTIATDVNCVSAMQCWYQMPQPLNCSGKAKLTSQQQSQGFPVLCSQQLYGLPKGDLIYVATGQQVHKSASAGTDLRWSQGRHSHCSSKV